MLLLLLLPSISGRLKKDVDAIIRLASARQRFSGSVAAADKGSGGGGDITNGNDSRLCPNMTSMGCAEFQSQSCLYCFNCQPPPTTTVASY